MSRVDLGPRCRHCKRDEATCARVAGCCGDCSHTFGEPLPIGRPRKPVPVEDRVLRQVYPALPVDEDCLPPDLIAGALRLVGAVRSLDPQRVGAVLAGLDARHVAVCLAALVPADCTPGELLAWNDSRYPKDRQQLRALRPCGTHAAFMRHKAAGERPCDVCVTGERRYQQVRHLRRIGRAS